jgi:cysteinyl-tRNA synthetase
MDLPGWLVEMREGFRKALFDDVNISMAMAALFKLVRQVNYLMATGRLFAGDARQVRTVLAEVDTVLGILPASGPAEAIPDAITEMVRIREQAREARDFDQADRLRDEIFTLGYSVEDLPFGPRVKKKA